MMKKIITIYTWGYGDLNLKKYLWKCQFHIENVNYHISNDGGIIRQENTITIEGNEEDVKTFISLLKRKYKIIINY